MNWFELVFHSDHMAAQTSPESTLLALLLAFLCGQIIGWAYLWTHNSLSYSQSFTASLVVMPVLVALMMILMSGSMMIAFGLLAVFAVVRFRNVLKDTRDTTFILWGIVEGMAIGTGRRSVAVVGVIVVSIVMAYLRVSTFGSRSAHDVVLNLLFPLTDTTQLQPVLRRHSHRIQVAASRKMTDDAWSHSYRLWLRDPLRSGELQQELESIEGVSNVDIFVQDASMEV